MLLNLLIANSFFYFSSMTRYIAAVLLLQFFVETLQTNSTNPQLTWGEIMLNQCGFRGDSVKLGLISESAQGRQSNEAEETVDEHFTKIENHPWQVAIIRRLNKVIECGGSIISKYHVLTAAHCFVKVDMEEINATATLVSYKARLVAVGSSRYAESDLEYKIKELHIHELYSYSHRRNDIALLKIDGEFEWTKYVQPICLPAEDEKYTPDLLCRISGFGNQAAAGPNNLGILRSGIVKLASDNHCKIGQKTQNVKITEGMFCALGYQGSGVMVDMCQSESGGPLHCESRTERVLFGITSVGHACRFNNDPGVYTKVSKYIQWIRDHVENRVLDENQNKNETTAAPVLTLTTPPLNTSKPASFPRFCGHKNAIMLLDGDNAVPAAGVDSGIEQIPWLVSLMHMRKLPRCLGVIISENYVLTTARCIGNKDRPEMAYYISADYTSLQGRERGYNITRIVIHPEYNAENENVVNDIALIELSEKFTFSNNKIQPICMPHSELYAKNGQAIFATFSSEMRLYQRVENLIAKEDCIKSYNRSRNITARMFCSVAEVNNETKVESREGGPLIVNAGVRHYLLGVFSWNKDDAPDVHTKVLEYIDWIEAVMKGVKY